MFLNDTLKMFQNCVVLALIGCASWDVRLGAAEALTPSQPLAGATVAGGTVAAATVTLPASCDIERLTELVSQATGVPLQWGAGKIQGSVRLSLPQAITTADLWSVYHQVLANQGLTTVVTGLPPVYQIVTIAEAAQSARTLSAEQLSTLPVLPGFQTVERQLTYISADTAVKIIGTILNTQGSQVRTLGGDGRHLLLSASTPRIAEMDSLLAVIDRSGQTPSVRMVKPLRTTPVALQAAATAAWTTLGRVDDHVRVGEIQVAPDGLQLLLIANTTDLDALERLVLDLDKSEPVETRSYRPRYFTLDEVANLIQQTMGTTTKVDIIRDRLTGSLLIKATTAEHLRIAALILSLDDAPSAARRQVRSLQVKHRRADEVARLLMSLVSAGGTDASPTAAASGQEKSGGSPLNSSAPANANGINKFDSAYNGTSTNTNSTSAGQSAFGNQPVQPLGVQGQQSSAASTAPTTARSADGSLVITADPVTNRLLVFGEPRVIDQIQELLTQVDQRQPQVNIEIILVGLTDEENLNLGVEMAKHFASGDITGDLTSLFGLSTPVAGAANPTARAAGNSNGFGGVVLKPGQYAIVAKALETVNHGNSTIRSQLVVANNAQATLNSIVQQPVSSINSSTQVATTSFAGTSDAGTQITVTPRISPADYVTLDYAVAQSAFLGAATVTADSAIPPTKRNDNVSSTATIPDGYVIALGGLSNKTIAHSESRIPWLGSIPFLGRLFSSHTDSTQDSRFYVFIRANILRNASFGDLRYSTDEKAKAAGIGTNGEPQLKAQLMH